MHRRPAAVGKITSHGDAGLFSVHTGSQYRLGPLGQEHAARATLRESAPEGGRVCFVKEQAIQTAQVPQPEVYANKLGCRDRAGPTQRESACKVMQWHQI